MAETPSNMLPLGTIAPDFTLPDTLSGKSLSLHELKSDKATVIMFICNHCPYVIHIQTALIQLAKKYQQLGVVFIAISSNDVKNYPADSPEKMQEHAKQNHFVFPYLYDETQSIAKQYLAACTPDFYIFDKKLACVYRGRFDDSTPGNNQLVTGNDLSQALNDLLEGKTPDPHQLPSVGCNIKWKK